MRSPFLAALIVAFATPAVAGYDASWYRFDKGWPGEYPTGFSVVGAAVTLSARAQPDRDALPTVACGLPQKAVFHPWNGRRKADFVTVQKIVPMKLKEDVTIGYDANTAKVRKGETVEYVVPGAEGSFTVRYKGKLYEADQALFEAATIADESLLDQRDLWLGVTCATGAKGWLLLDDLKDDKAPSGWMKGLGSWEPGRIDFGKVRDLTDADLRKAK